jgi:hypothetical protein
MNSFFIFLLGFILFCGLMIGALFLAGIAWVVLFKPRTDHGNRRLNHSLTIYEKEKGVLNMDMQNLWEQISKIIEEKAGIKLPKPKSIEQILASLPATERARLLPTLVPIVVKAIQDSTGMKLDAAITLEEYLLGKGLGITQLDVAIETDKMKLEKTLAGRLQIKEITDHYREKMGEDPVIDFVEKMTLYRLVVETFKDMQLPPGWSPQRIVGLLEEPSPDEDIDPDVIEVRPSRPHQSNRGVS